MIEIERVVWNNFISYGNYDTTLELSNLNDTLISGYNGAGKSTVVSAIQWCLCNRTMHKPNPGPKIHNWNNKLDTSVYIDLKNGLRIERIRTRSGDSNLYIYNRHISSRDEINAPGTNRLQNEDAQRKLGIDWDMFTASTCLGQFNKPWLVMSPDKRKKTIERLLKLDMFENCSNSANGLKIDVNKEISIKEAELIQEQSKLQSLINELESVKTKNELAKQNRDRKKQESINALQQAIQYLETNQIIDIEELSLQNAKKVELTDASNKLKAIRNRLLDRIKELDIELNRSATATASMRTKIGQICSSCKQIVDKEHVEKEIAELAAIAITAGTEKSGILSKISEIDIACEKVSQLMPNLPYSVEHAKLINSNIEQVQQNILTIRQNIELLDQQELVESTNFEEIQLKMNEYTTSIEAVSKEINELKYRYKHIDYLYNYYHRRDMGKSIIFADHVPNINNRLKMYLDHFESPVDIKINDDLSIESNKWGYDFTSGGERSAIDMALMFGIYDFYESVYGRQSNFIVLDEVDKSVDEIRRQKLIELIKVDLSQRMDCVLVISHSQSMHNILSREYKAIMTDEGSKLVEI